MKLLTRCGFLALIALCLAIQATHGQHGDSDSDPMAGLALGLKRLNVETDPSTEADILTGRSRSCQQPIHAMFLRIDGADAERLDGLPQDENVFTYIYLGSAGQSWEKAAIIRRSVWAGLWFAVGLRSGRPPHNLVVVMLPRACPDMGGVVALGLSLPLARRQTGPGGFETPTSRIRGLSVS
jgi:hypothetical protein